MIRVLVLIAVAGALLSLATLSAAVMITGPEAISRGAWSFGPWGWQGRWHGGWHGGWRGRGRGWRDADDAGPEVTREIAWSGGDALDIDLPADVSFTQAPGPPKLTVIGPRDVVADVRMEDGRIGFADEEDGGGELRIAISAPSVSRFKMDGSGSLAIAGYSQDTLYLDLAGSSTVTATGAAKSLRVDISGSAAADLGKVKTGSAAVDISGSGSTTVAPSDSADVRISGSGDVTLLTRPPKLETDISGSGRVHQGAAGDAPPAA